MSLNGVQKDILTSEREREKERENWYRTELAVQIVYVGGESGLPSVADCRATPFPQKLLTQTNCVELQTIMKLTLSRSIFLLGSIIVYVVCQW